MKKLAKLFLVLFIAASIFPTTYTLAESNDDVWVLKVNENGESYLYNTDTGDTASQFCRVDGTKLTAQIAQKVLNQNIRNESMFPVSGSLSTYGVSDLSDIVITVENGEEVKVTPDVLGPASITYGQQFTFTESYSSEITLTYDMKRSLKSAATFAWEASAQNSASFGMTFNVNSGKIGAVYFIPYYNHIYAQYHIGDMSWRVGGRSPKKVGGFADGLYYCKNCQ